MKSKFTILICFVLIFTFFVSSTQLVTAARKENEKTGLIAMYNPSGGGFLASIALKVETSIYYTPTGFNPDYNFVEFVVQTSTLKGSFAQCGGTMNTISPLKMGGTEITLRPDTFLIPDDGYARDILKSTRDGRQKGTYTIESSGQFYPNPSTCMGGGRVTSTFTFYNY
ncbi:hypothetical protein J2T56_002788 [Natronobacillus azotifigens]|uniref:Uncharacterized protein n=1 Tax=Natronobacillus azotifigens TaxID=472978 RepID=A0A9J6RG62_9BACI|nr:hypothetical protein [Natronobacillus azotifigens]MCZ0704396.1 hypothetical protein [Natronobacillus azotifigens]